MEFVAVWKARNARTEKNVSVRLSALVLCHCLSPPPPLTLRSSLSPPMASVSDGETRFPSLYSSDVLYTQSNRSLSARFRLNLETTVRTYYFSVFLRPKYFYVSSRQVTIMSKFSVYLFHINHHLLAGICLSISTETGSSD
jgi:hypothetical protein